MHREVRRFIKEVRRDFPYKFRRRTVLEVGSHNINGSPRDFFYLCKWTGVDISKGKGVDIVGKFSTIPFDKQFQVVISTETLEHDDEWDITLKKMYNLLLPGGLMIVTCASVDRQEHGTKRTCTWPSPDTTDYYRNISTADFKSVLDLDECFVFYCLMNARGLNDLQFYGIKHYLKNN